MRARALCRGRAAPLVAAVTALFSGLAVTAAAPAYAASAITGIQGSPVASVTSGNVTPTLPAASTAGDLLVVTLASNSATAFSGPTGWVRGPSVSKTSTTAEIWYYPNNPGGITSASFGNSSTFTAGQITEWRGAAIAPLDTTGTTTASAATSATVTSSASTAAPGDVAITAFAEATTHAPAFTPGTGWSNAGSKLTSAIGFTSDYWIGVAKGSVSETETSTKSGTWAGVVATFEPTCSTGALGVAPPGSFSFAPLTLNGKDETDTANPAVTVDDETNSDAGWNLELTSTPLTAASHTLSTSAATLTGSSAALASGGCSAATNSVAYPITVPSGSTPPTPVKVYDAAAASGAGPEVVTLDTSLAVPANSYSGSYSSTWTFTIASGP